MPALPPVSSTTKVRSRCLLVFPEFLLAIVLCGLSHLTQAHGGSLAHSVSPEANRGLFRYLLNGDQKIIESKIYVISTKGRKKNWNY